MNSGFSPASDPTQTTEARKETAMTTDLSKIDLSLGANDAPKPLIPVCVSRIGETEIQTVSARELHGFLEVKKDFSDWIKVQLEIFTQGTDFEVFSDSGKNPLPQKGERENQGLSDCSPEKGSNAPGWKTRIEYALTLDCAKHIAMMSRTEKGRQARDYFLECERQAKEARKDPLACLADPSWLRGTLLTYTEKVIELESRLEEQAPKVAALERFADHEGKHNLRNAAKVLGVQEHKLKTWLLINKWYYRDHGGRLCAHADKITAGYLDTIPVEIRRTEGIQIVPQPVITQKGLTRLAELLVRDGLLPRKAA
jgi:phage anti-repressor protein/phage antirepressor YoqD-like protein